MTKVKICGITNLEDALLSAKFGADALGFNFYEKSPRYILPEKAREIIAQLPAEVLKVGVFVNESLDKITEIAEIAKLDALQLHGEETPEFAKALKAKTNLEIIKAFRVSPEFKPEDVLKYEVDAVLLDAYSPKEHGGTGEIFDWEFARKVQKIFPKMYLAGGLSHDNIVYALQQIHPFAVDACSCLEKKKGKKDKQKVFKFTSVVKNHKISGIDNIYDLLFLIRLRPKKYIGERSTTSLRTYLETSHIVSNLEDLNIDLNLITSNFDWKKFRPNEESFWKSGFQSWVTERFLGSKVSHKLWDKIILEECNGDEEKAFDLFFALLEEFKLEKEDLSNE